MSSFLTLDVHSLASASQPRLSATGPKWFVFETSDLRSLDNIALNPSLHKGNHE